MAGTCRLCLALTTVGLSFAHDAVAVNVNGENLALFINFHLDVVRRLKRVVLALSADHNSSSQRTVRFVVFECVLELARLDHRALEHRVVDETCLNTRKHVVLLRLIYSVHRCFSYT